jgi:hypothetical protein
MGRPTARSQRSAFAARTTSKSACGACPSGISVSWADGPAACPCPCCSVPYYSHKPLPWDSAALSAPGPFLKHVARANAVGRLCTRANCCTAWDAEATAAPSRMPAPVEECNEAGCPPACTDVRGCRSADASTALVGLVVLVRPGCTDVRGRRVRVATWCRQAEHRVRQCGRKKNGRPISSAGCLRRVNLARSADWPYCQGMRETLAPLAARKRGSSRAPY